MAFPHQHHRAVIEDFLDAIEQDRDPAVTGREALKVHRLIAAILRSSETGERVKAVSTAARLPDTALHDYIRSMVAPTGEDKFEESRHARDGQGEKGPHHGSRSA